MSFEQLCWAATAVTSERDPLHLVHEWSAKRDALHMQLLDIPQLVADFQRRRVEKDPNNPHRLYIDSVPTLRLANACESTCHALYSTAEVAASFANKVSKGVIPSSFNAIRKKVKDGGADPELAAALADVQWYEKVREVRTEWTHHSSIFVGEARDREPLFVVRAWRRPSDKEHFKEKVEYSVSEILHWTRNAIRMLDAFGAYLLKKYVLPSFDMAAQIVSPKREADGFPVMLADGRVDVEIITLREYLEKLGVEVPPAAAADPAPAEPVPPAAPSTAEVPTSAADPATSSSALP